MNVKLNHDSFTRLARWLAAGNFVSDCSAASRAVLQYTVASKYAAFQRTGSRIFSIEKLPQSHSISSILLNLPFKCPELSIFEVNKQKKTTEDKI